MTVFNSVKAVNEITANAGQHPKQPGIAGTSALAVKNQILTRVPSDAFDRLRPHLKRIEIKKRAILQDHCRPIEYVHFIERGVASTFARTNRDGPVEVSLVGRFGLVGVSVVLGAMDAPHRCVMHMDGETIRLPAMVFAQALDEHAGLRRQMLSYVNVLLIQNAQRCLCNARHDITERLSRWLLLAHDRLDCGQIPVTHERLSTALAVRRAGITEALARLEDTGAVRRHRGTVEIADRSVLERRACECYHIVAGEFRKLLEPEQMEYDLRAADPV
jgi:CRP-like cAMP-binding protein